MMHPKQNTKLSCCTAPGQVQPSETCLGLKFLGVASLLNCALCLQGLLLLIQLHAYSTLHAASLLNHEPCLQGLLSLM